MKDQFALGLMYICFLCILSLSACKKNILPDENLRTVLVYMGGDNNLSDETDEKIASLRKSVIPNEGRLLIFQDALNQSPRLLEIKSGNLTTLKVYDPESSASPGQFPAALPRYG